MSPLQENIFEPQIAVSLHAQQSTADAAQDGAAATQRDALVMPAGGLFEEPPAAPGGEAHGEPPITVTHRGWQPAEPASPTGPDTDLPPWRPRARRPAAAAEARLRRDPRRGIRRAAIPVASALLSFLIATAVIALLHGAPSRPVSGQPSTPANDPHAATASRMRATTAASHHATPAHAPRRAPAPTRALRTPGRRRAQRASRPPVALGHPAPPPVAVTAPSPRFAAAAASPTPSSSAPAPPAAAPPVSASHEFGFER
jgi:hypothetical protein